MFLRLYKQKENLRIVRGEEKLNQLLQELALYAHN